MIATVLRISLLNLLRDRVALVLTFVLPIVFFSIFAAVFAGMDEESVRPIPALISVDTEGGFAGRFAARLRNDASLDVVRFGAIDRSTAAAAVRHGEVVLAIVVPRDAGPAVASGGERPAVELLADSSNPLALGLVRGLLQAHAVAVTGELLAPALTIPASRDSAATTQLLPVQVIDVHGRTGKRPSVSFFAAGLGVMFLLFAVSGRSAVLIEERESGVLRRMLAARVGLTRLLLGRWLYLVALGTAQVAVMFGWAAVAFGLDLFTPRNAAGFLLVTLPTAAAAAAFGLVLSAACRTRAQLNGVSVVVVLTLSALGGSMFPSFLMPEGLQKIGGLTFNAWALNAYHDVFWYDNPLSSVLPEIARLTVCTFVFLAIARLLADRWQRVDRSAA